MDLHITTPVGTYTIHGERRDLLCREMLQGESFALACDREALASIEVLHDAAGVSVEGGNVTAPAVGTGHVQLRVTGSSGARTLVNLLVCEAGCFDRMHERVGFGPLDKRGTLRALCRTDWFTGRADELVGASLPYVGPGVGA